MTHPFVREGMCQGRSIWSLRDVTGIWLRPAVITGFLGKAIWISTSAPGFVYFLFQMLINKFITARSISFIQRSKNFVQFDCDTSVSNTLYGFGFNCAEDVLPVGALVICSVEFRNAASLFHLSSSLLDIFSIGSMNIFSEANFADVTMCSVKCILVFVITSFPVCESPLSHGHIGTGSCQKCHDARSPISDSCSPSVSSRAVRMRNEASMYVRWKVMLGLCNIAERDKHCDNCL